MLILMVLVIFVSDHWFGRYWPPKLSTFYQFWVFFAYNLGTKEALSFVSVYLIREFNSLNGSKLVALLLQEKIYQESMLLINFDPKPFES